MGFTFIKCKKMIKGSFGSKVGNNCIMIQESLNMSSSYF